jgi:uncharacterized protein YhjY with autotransporter beta-barrel domain
LRKMVATRVALACSVASISLCVPAFSYELENYSEWNQTQFWGADHGYWGATSNDTYGQAFTVPSGGFQINSFKIYLKNSTSGQTTNFKLYLYELDRCGHSRAPGTTRHCTLTGSPLYESSTQSITSTGSTQSISEAFSAPVDLDDSKKYAVVVSTRFVSDPGSGSWQFARNGATDGTIQRILRADSSTSQSLTTANHHWYYGRFGHDGVVSIDFTTTDETIDSGENYASSNPVKPVIFNGGKITVDSSAFGDNFTVYAQGGTIDSAGFDTSFSGVLSGSGSVELTNSGVGGVFEIASDQSITGGLVANSGVHLKINADTSSASVLTLKSGSTLTGSGVAPETIVLAGAMHGPGNSIGEQTVSGNYTLSSGAQLQVEVKGPQNDKISVSGIATIDGEVLIVPFEGGSPFPFFDYQIIDSDSNVVFNGSINQDLVTSTLLSYGADLVVGNDGDPTTFDIAWLPKNGVGVVGSALTRLGNNESNQKSTARVLDSSFKSLAIAAANTTGTSGKNATGEAIGNTGFTNGQAAAAGYSSDYIQLLDDLVQLSSPGQLAAAINSLSPEPYAAFQAVGLNSLKQQRELLATHAGSCKDTGWVVSMPNTESSVPGKNGAKLPICVFADAAKSNSSINGSEGLSSYLSNSNIAYWGLEYFPSKQWTVGAAYGYGSSSLYGMSLTSAGVSSTYNSGAVYGVYKPIERLKLQAAFGYTGFSVEGTRTVSFIGNGQPINGNTSANGYTTSFDAKYDIPINTGSKKDWLVVSPIAGIAWGAYQQKGFEETGGGATDLQVNGHTSNSLVGTIGFELSTTPIKFTKSGKQSFAPKLALAYQVAALANANYTKELTASFVDAPGAGVITTQGQNGGANSFTIAAGGDLQIYENASLYATISHEVENAGSQFGYSGGVRFLF